MSFGTIFGTLFWDYIMILWDENYVSKLLIGPKQVFFSVINHNKFSSQDNTKRTWTSLMWKKSCTTGLESRDTWTIWKSCQADWAFGALNPGLGSILELDYRLSTGFYYFEMEEWKRPDTYVYIWSKKKIRKINHRFWHTIQTASEVLFAYSHEPVYSSVWCCESSHSGLRSSGAWGGLHGLLLEDGLSHRAPACGFLAAPHNWAKWQKTHQNSIFKRSRIWRDYSDHYACNSLKNFR